MLKTVFKNSLALLLCVIMLICSIPVNAFADDKCEIKLYLNPYADTSLQLEQTMAPRMSKLLIETINTQIKNCVEEVDIYSFKLVNNEENQQKIIDILSGELPECFHIGQVFYIVPSNDGYISGIKPTYVYEKNEYKAMLTECEKVADRMLQGIKGNESLTDIEKLILLHDRIAISCEYDYERYYSSEGVPLISHTMYGVLINNIAVCQGYALAYSYLLDKIGIENYYCGSQDLCHAWNIVYVNDKAYHVDITWDDEPWDITGKVTHEYFLVSTNELRENGHNAYDYDDSPVDTTFDDYFWEESEAAFTLLGNEIYYIDGKDTQTVAIKRLSDKKTVYSTEHKWRTIGTKYYPGNFARLDTDGKDLLFSLSDGIYKLNVKTGVAEQIYEPDTYGSSRIYGFTYDDGKLLYDISTKPYLEGPKIYYQYETPYSSVYTPGDIDNSESINLVDVVVLARAIAHWNVYYNVYALDVNGDGDNTLQDVNYLARYVAGWQGIVLN